MNLLVVDDEFFVSNGIADSLRCETLDLDEIYNTYSVQGAKELMEQHPIDIVITDVEMPEENGFVLLNWIRESGRNVISILLTGHKKFEYAYDAVEYGCFSYLVKPVSNEKLKSTLVEAIEKLQEDRIFAQWRNNLSKEELEEYLRKESQVDLVGRIKRIIKENIASKDLGRAFIAQQVYMNEDYLSYIFHQRAGVTLKGYIIAERVKYAKRLLRTTNSSIDQISEKAGFSDPAYFCRVFRKQEGLTPNQYRSSTKP